MTEEPGKFTTTEPSVEKSKLQFHLGLPRVSVDMSLTYWGRDKMADILQTKFSNNIFFNENVWIPIDISMKFVSSDPVDNKPVFGTVIFRRRIGDKPLPEPMIKQVIARAQWGK